MKEQTGQVGAIILTIIGFFVIATVLGVAGTFFKLFTLPWFQFSTQVNQNQQIISKTYDANNQIYNYHWFQETAGAITALDEQIATAQANFDNFELVAGQTDRKDWTFEDKTEESRLRSIVQGLKSQRSSVTNEYNARAKEADRSIFQNGLKTFIPLN